MRFLITFAGMDARVLAGQAVYTKRMLRAYDVVVLGISNALVWRVPTARLRELYDRNLSGRHLDVGVGSGYFLDHGRFPEPDPDITLADLNTTALDYVRGRLRRYPQVTTVRVNALEPLPIERRFDSISLTYLLHCIPGPMADKGARVLNNLKALLTPGGVLFGATLLADRCRRFWAAEKLAALYNDRGIFNNLDDTVPALERVLKDTFAHHELDLVGAAAVFTCRAADG
jgi:SAM-dependent methyltransferase